MDKIIHKHLDRRMDLQDSATAMLDEVLNAIDLRKLLRGPKQELGNVAHVALGVAEAHAKDAVKEGIRFAKEVKAKGAVTVDKSKDPNLNEGEL